MQFVNDLPGVLAQIRRILAPDGLFLAALVGGQTLRELRACLAWAQEEIEGGASPRVAPFADLRDLGALMQRAGLALPVADCDSFTVRYPSVFELFRDLRGMGATNALLAGARRPLRRAVLFRAAKLYREQFSDPDGKIRASFEIIWASGWAPHESQQKPLAPGSAQARLQLGSRRQERRSLTGFWGACAQSGERGQTGGQQKIPPGQRQAEDAQRDLVAAHDVDVLQLLAEILHRGRLDEIAGAVGRPRPEFPFDAGVIGAKIALPRKITASSAERTRAARAVCALRARKIAAAASGRAA